MESRYARHFSVPEIGVAGQAKLGAARVLCIGAGGIGSPALLYLAAMGVGHLGVVDDDEVSLSNLQRQILFTTAELGQSKARLSKMKLAALNPEISLQAFETRLTRENAEEIFQGFDLIVDGSDNYETRYLANDICCFLGKPLISASVYLFTGQLALFNAAGGPCYRCLFPKAPPQGLIPNCAEAGVPGVIPGIMASLAVNEALKWILGLELNLRGILLTFDGLECQLRKYPIRKRADCPACVGKQIQKEIFMTTCNVVPTMTVHELAVLLRSPEPPLLVDVREPWEHAEFALPNSQLLPLATVSADHIPKTARPVVCYCKLGGRSASAVKLLLEQGLKNIYSLEGGMTAWQREFVHA